MKKALIYLTLFFLLINIAFAECPSIFAIKKNKLTDFYEKDNEWIASAHDNYGTSYTWYFEMIIPALTEEEAHQKASLALNTLQFINGPVLDEHYTYWCYFQTALGDAHAHRSKQRS